MNRILPFSCTGASGSSWFLDTWSHTGILYGKALASCSVRTCTPSPLPGEKDSFREPSRESVSGPGLGLGLVTCLRCTSPVCRRHSCRGYPPVCTCHSCHGDTSWSRCVSDRTGNDHRCLHREEPPPYTGGRSLNTRGEELQLHQ